MTYISCSSDLCFVFLSLIYGLVSYLDFNGWYETINDLILIQGQCDICHYPAILPHILNTISRIFIE